MAEVINLNQFIVNYQRKVKQKCDICNSNFRLGKSQHLCKRCCRCVCEDCAPFKVKCYMQDNKNAPHRMCRKCHIQSEILRKYIKLNNLKWGQDSDLVKIWLKQLGFTTVPKKRVSQKKKLTQSLTFKDIWRSLNFSFRQFIGIIIDQSKVPQKQFVQLVNLALSELTSSKLADLQHIIYVVLFFLCHCTIYNAIYFTTLIIQINYTQDFSLENVYYFLQQMNCSEIQINKMENILQETFQMIVKRCTLNVFTTEISIQIISHILAKRQFQQLEKGIAYVFSKRKQFICQNSNKPDQVLLDILRNIQSTDYRKVIKAIDGSPSPQRQQKSIRSRDNSQKSQSKDSVSSQGSKQRFSKDLQIQILKKQNTELHQKIREQSMIIEQLREQKHGPRGKVEVKRLKMNEYSTSEQSNDQSNYSELINKKNIQIIQLKKQIQSLKQLNKQLNTTTLNKSPEREQQHRKSIRDKDDLVSNLKQQVQNLRSTNKKLFMKLGQLSNLLMDKQQETIKQANQKFQQLSKDISTTMNNQQLQKQCAIF